jgi:hypothetical protein
MMNREAFAAWIRALQRKRREAHEEEFAPLTRTIHAQEVDDFLRDFTQEWMRRGRCGW